MTHYDIIIIGGGPGGYETAVEAAARGSRVALIERDALGGTCLNRGCIPTKAFASSARTAMALREAAGFGFAPVDCTPDMAAIVSRKDAIVSELRQGVETLLKDVDVIHGQGALGPGPMTVTVDDDRQLTASRIIIATGSAPAILSIPGAELAMTSDEILNIGSVPRRLVIIGGGVIGIEFASVFEALGSQVTVVEYCPEILPQFDSEIAKRLRMSLKRRGVKIEVATAVNSIERDAESGQLKVGVTSRRSSRTLEADTVLMAVGRKPVVPPGAEQCGILVSPRGIKVDESTMATSADGIYAIGDVNGLMQLAHVAVAQGRVALGLDQPLYPVPSAVFSEPEAAMVGVTQQECEAEDRRVAVGRASFRSNGRAMAASETDGLVKVIVDCTTGRIIGAHIVGAHASDLIQEAALAISSGIEATEVAYSIHAHPTLSETMLAAVKSALEK